MKKNNCPDMKYLFEPGSIAVIGASHDKGKIGYKIVENIFSGGYRGHVYPVNPVGGKILGAHVFESLEFIEDTVDVACIIVPARQVFDAIRSCGQKGVKFSMIISSGFSEVGNIEEEKKIVSCARAHGMRVLGPNMFGIYSAAASLNATFGPKDINPGEVAIITQSGALGLSMIGKTAVENIGLSTIVSVGNKSDLDEADLLEYLVRQDSVKVILIYIEGVREGEELVKALKEATQKKPVIVIKSGRSKKGAVAVTSHTGSLAGTDNVFDPIMRQCGVLRAETINEALNWCKFISSSPLPLGKETVIITNGGGLGVLATDACEKYGIKLYDDAAILKKVFSSVTPEFGSLKNPIDITGQAKSFHYNTALDSAFRCDEIAMVIALYCDTAVFGGENLITMIKENYSKSKDTRKLITFSAFGGEDTQSGLQELDKLGIPVYGDVYEAVSPLGAVYSYYHYLKNRTDKIDDIDIDVDPIDKIVWNVRKEGRFFLLAHEAQDIMRIVDIQIPKSLIASTLEKAVKGSRAIGYPVVMKVVSKEIIHKSDVGGVALDLLNENEVIDAYEAIIRNCKTKVPGAVIEGVEIAEMVTRGTEAIVGAKIDPSFGPIVMAGLGGIYVEVLKDVSFRAYPLDRREILSMIKELRAYPLLLGVRGEKMRDINCLVDTIIKLGAIIKKCKGISDIEINPLVMYEQGMGAQAVDVRVLLLND